MRSLFLFGGLPHYYNAILNRLNNNSNIEISVVIPKSKSSSIGKGVHQTASGTDFETISLRETKAFYGKPKFIGLSAVIEKNKPEIIVTIWPYVLMFLFDRKLKKIIRKNKIKIVYKDIPFRIPNYKDVYKWDGEQFFDENLKYEKSRGFIPLIQRAVLGIVRKRYLNKVDAHVYYTEKAFDIIGSYGVPKEKIFIIYNSPDTDKLFESANKVESLEPLIPKSPHRIIHVGRLVKWKRVDLLIRALKLLKEKNKSIELLVIGDGPELNYLKQLAAELNIQENVRFYGAVYDLETMANLMKLSSIYVLAGMGGLSINEAMAYGKPVICSICDGTEKKLVREKFNGLYFEQENTEDLADKILTILKDQKLIEVYGKNSLSIIRNEVNINTVIDGYIKAFNFVTDNKYDLKLN